jgi:hypothetical protein
MRRILFFAVFLIFVFCNSAYAQTPPPSQTAGGLERTQADIQRQRELEREITKKKTKEAGRSR